MIRLSQLPEGLAPSHPVAWISTWFGSGLLRPASGTWGSAAALPFASAIAWAAGPAASAPVLATAALVAFALGVWASGIYSVHKGVSDSGDIVIDEVAGQWLTLAFVPLDPLLYAVGFFLFRFFDVLKPFPAGWCDRNLKGGFGVMVDDMFAGLYSGILLWALHRWLI